MTYVGHGFYSTVNSMQFQLIYIKSRIYIKPNIYFTTILLGLYKHVCSQQVYFTLKECINSILVVIMTYVG